MLKTTEYGAKMKIISMLISIVLLTISMQASAFARSHPFVFFTNADIPALRAKVSQDGSRSKKAYDLFFTGTPTLDLQEMGGLKHEVFFQKQLLQVALKYTITGDSKYADRAISGIDRAMEMYNPDTFNWEDTGWAQHRSDAQKKMVGSWLWGWGFGEVTRAVAVTYDIVYDEMTVAKRAQVLDWLETVCHHFKNNVNDGGRRDVLHNHTLPPYAAMAFTCWIIRDDTTDEVIKNQYPAYANDFIRRWYDEMYFQPNGDFTESALYSYFGADTCFTYSAALHINNEPDILSGTSASNVLKFIGHGTLAYQENGFPILPGFGDSHDRYNMTRYSCALVPILISQDPVQLFYYKHSIDDLNNMQRIPNTTEDIGLVNNNSLVNTVLFFPEGLREQHPRDAGVSDSQLFLDHSGIGGSAALRSGWDLPGTGKDTVTAWFVNRYNRVNHNHHDMNAVELAAYGEYFLIDPIHELYGSPRHGSSLGHNHIIIDDIGLPSSAARTGGCYADCSTFGEIHGFTSGDGGTVLRGDARYSYVDRLPIAEVLDRSNISLVTREDIDNHGAPLDKAERVFGLINGGSNPPYAIIIDEIKRDSAEHKYDFRLHTYKSLSGLGTPAKPFVAKGTNASLYVTLVQPEAFTGSTGEYGERPSAEQTENNNMIDAVQRGVTGHFFAILYPRKNDMPNAAISSSAVENGVGAVVSWGSEDGDVLLEKRRGSLIRYKNVVSGGRFASVRGQSGRVASYLLLEGDTLSYNGTPLVSISGGGSASASADGTIASVDAPGTSGFSIYAPAATTMLLNGSKIEITRKGDYIVFGDGGS